MCNRLLSSNGRPGEVLRSCLDAGAGGSATGFYSHPFSYGSWAFTAMAVNRAVSSHLYRVGLTRAGVPGAATLPLDRMTSRSAVDELTCRSVRVALSNSLHTTNRVVRRNSRSKGASAFMATERGTCRPSSTCPARRL